MTVGPVFVTVEAPRTAKLCAEPSGGADCAQPRLPILNMQITNKSFFMSKLLGWISVHGGCRGDSSPKLKRMLTTNANWHLSPLGHPRKTQVAGCLSGSSSLLGMRPMLGGGLRELHRSHLCQEDFPIIRSGQENDTHAVHPGALFAGEKRVFPQNNRDEKLVGVSDRGFNDVACVFLCVRGEERFKSFPDFFAIPTFSGNVDELRVFCEKRNQFLGLEPLEAGKETIEPKRCACRGSTLKFRSR